MNRRDIFKLFGGAAALPAVKSVETLVLKKDETLIATVDRNTPQDQLDKIAYQLRQALPEGTRLIVVGDDVTFRAIRHESAGTR